MKKNALFCIILVLLAIRVSAQSAIVFPTSAVDTVEDFASCGTSADYIKFVNDSYIAYQSGSSLPSWGDSPFTLDFIGQGNFNSQYSTAYDETCTDFFRIYYEDDALNTGLGFNHPTLGNDRKATLCRVLNDIEDIIDFSNLSVSGGANKRIDLFISRSFDKNGTNQYLPPMTTTPPIIPTITPYNVLGAPFFSSNVNTASGYFGGNMHDYILSGNDPDPNNYDGQVLVNFARLYTQPMTSTYSTPESYWNNSTNTTANCSYDLYSILLHEITHVMGWYSMIGQSAAPNLDAVSIAGSHFFSLLDQHYYYHTGTAPNFAPTTTSLIPFTTLNGVSQPQINPTITALSPVSLPSSLGNISRALSTNRVWLGNEGNPYSHPVNSEYQTYFSSSLSASTPSGTDPTYPYHLCHLDYSDRSFYSRTQISPGFQPHYVMDWWFSRNEKRRQWTLFEMRTLQNKLGYGFNNSFLVSTSLNSSYTNGAILANHPPYRVNNNVLISAIIDDIISYPNFSTYASTTNYYPENCPIDFTQINNNTVANPTQTQIVIDLSLFQNGGTPILADDDNDPISIKPNSLFGIRGVSDGGNNHNRLSVNAAGTVITYTPEPGYIGLAQFGFHLWDGKEQGAFKIITIKLDKPLLAVALQTIPTSGGNLVINGSFEDGTEVKQYNNTSKPYSRYDDGYHAKENVIHTQLSGAHPFMHWMGGSSYDNFWNRPAGVIIKDAAHSCEDGLNPSFTQTFNLQSPYVESGAFSTVMYNTGLSQAALLCHPQTVNPTLNQRYAISQQNSNPCIYSSLKVPLQSCHTYRIMADVALLSAYALPTGNLLVNIAFTKDPSLQYPPIGSNVLQSEQVSVPITNALINSDCLSQHWGKIEKTFTYCGTQDCDFFALMGNKIVSYFDNISIVEVSNPALTANITATNAPALCGVNLSANILGTTPCGTTNFTYSWSTGATTPSIVATQTGNYSVWITGCGVLTASYTVTTLPASIDAGLPVALCPGQQTTLSPTPIGVVPVSYTWLPSAGLSCTNCANPVFTAGSTTTFTVTATLASGCHIADNVTITVLPPDYSCLELFKSNGLAGGEEVSPYTIAVVSGDEVYFRICVRNKCNTTIDNVVLTDLLPQELTFLDYAANPVTITEDFSTHTLISAPFSLAPFSPPPSVDHLRCFTIHTQVGNVPNETDCLIAIDNTVTASADNGVCTSPTATGSVYVMPSTVGLTFHNGETSSQLPQSIYINEKIVIAGNFFIDNGFTLQNCDVILTPGSAIHVGDPGGMYGGKLLLDGSTLRGCDKLWKSIFVHKTGYLHSYNDTYIEDAERAVVLYGGFITDPGTPVGCADIENTHFDKNYIGIDIPDAAYDEGALAPYLRLNEFVEFDATAHLLGHYGGMWQTPLQMGDLSYAGIRVNHYNLSINPLSPSAALTPRVHFHNQNIGILSFASILKLNKCTFEDIQPDNVYTPPFPFAAKGIGILALGFKADMTLAPLCKLYQNGFVPNIPTFKNCYVGIASYAMYRSESEQNTMENMRTGIQVALLDNTKKVFIHHNNIEAWATGIGLAFCAGAFSNVFENTLHLIAPPTGSTIGQAVAIAAGDYVNLSSDVFIHDNAPIQLSTPGIGIQLQIMKKGFVTHNTLMIDNGLVANGAGTVASTIAGVQVNGGKQNSLTCNTVTGPGGINQINTPEALPTDPTNSDYIAYHINGSPDNHYDCNYSDGTKFGFHFNDNCKSDNNFNGNEMHDHYEGLRINNQAYIGSQQTAANAAGTLEYRGNRWTGVSGNFEARNLGVSAQSLFYVNSSGINGLDYDPLPKFPPSFLWINPVNVYDNYSCDNSSYCGTDHSGNRLAVDSLLSETDYAIANDSLLTYEYQEQVRWASERDLYNRLRENPLLLSDSEMADFYLSFQNSTIETLSHIQDKERRFLEIDSVKTHSLDSLALHILNRQSLIATNDSLLGTGGDSTVLMAQTLQLYLQINQLNQSAQALLQVERIQDSLAIDSTRLVNTSIISNKLYEQNEKAVKEIYYATIGSGIYTFSASQVADLYAIASQCPLAGGNAVFAARNIYRWINDEIGFNDRALCEVVGMQYRQSNQDNYLGTNNFEGFMVYPNPSASILHIKNSTYPVHFELFDALSRNVLEKDIELESQEIGIQTLSSGIYYYKASSNHSIIRTGKIIIQH